MKTIKIDDKEYQLDVEKAKKMGLLKDTKPRSWEEYCNNSGKAIYAYDEFSSCEESMAFIAFGKLIQLRDAWWGDWKPNWYINSKCKYTIETVCGKISKTQAFSINTMLVFPTNEMRDDFFKTFRDLIEQAKMFL